METNGEIINKMREYIESAKNAIRNAALADSSRHFNQAIDELGLAVAQLDLASLILQERLKRPS